MSYFMSRLCTIFCSDFQQIPPKNPLRLSYWRIFSNLHQTFATKHAAKCSRQMLTTANNTPNFLNKLNYVKLDIYKHYTHIVVVNNIRLLNKSSVYRWKINSFATYIIYVLCVLMATPYWKLSYIIKTCTHFKYPIQCHLLQRYKHKQI